MNYKENRFNFRLSRLFKISNVSFFFLAAPTQTSIVRKKQGGVPGSLSHAHFNIVWGVLAAF